MRSLLLKTFLYIWQKLPSKNHPFNESKDWILNMNYSIHEYEGASYIEKEFWKYFDFKTIAWKKLLDIWCGWWWRSVYLAEKYKCEVLWIDVSEEFIGQARQIAKEKNVDNITKYLIWDAHNLDIVDNSIDIIILNDVIEHIPNTKKMLEECYRVLKKDWIILWNFAPYYEFFGHHLWDTLPIPWLHLITTEKFRIDLYKMSLEWFPDKDIRLNLRVSKLDNWQESFTYLNKITLKKFQEIKKELFNKGYFTQEYEYQHNIKWISFLWKIPLFREIFARLRVWIWKK